MGLFAKKPEAKYLSSKIFKSLNVGRLLRFELHSYIQDRENNKSCKQSFKISNCTKKTIGAPSAPPHSIRCLVQVQIQIAGGPHLTKAGIQVNFQVISFIVDHYSKVKTYLGKLKKFEVMLSTKKNEQLQKVNVQG